MFRSNFIYTLVTNDFIWWNFPFFYFKESSIQTYQWKLTDKMVAIVLSLEIYAFAGTYHFYHPNYNHGLIPATVPFPESVNYISGFLD